MAAFPPEKIEAFFEEQGCALKVERGNRVFPVSDRSQSVLQTLQIALRQNHVAVETAHVTGIRTENGAVTGVEADGRFLSAKWVILATGGLSYPTTGSTGEGYRMAEALGHTVTPCHGSLVPLETEGLDCPEMQGLSLRNVAVKLVNEKGKTVFSDFGELLFTHFGVSGPTVLSASAHLPEGKCRLVIDLKPALDEEKLDERLLRDLELYKNRAMENAMVDLLPRSMIPVILRRANIDPAMQANALMKKDRRRLLSVLKGFDLTVTGRRPVAEAIITSGGVKVSEVDPKTMESKLVKNFYFAGEILDCDAYTGGFNLQIAWATAFSAGNAAADKNRD